MAKVPPCAYRDYSDEAYSIDPATGRQQRIELSLCQWPTTLGPHPRWVDRSIGKGLAIDPEKDCPGCPVAATGGRSP